MSHRASNLIKAGGILMWRICHIKKYGKNGNELLN